MKAGYRLLAAGLTITAIFPCAVDISPLFVPVRQPEKFDSAFVRGELGIIPASLSGNYKLIAWRYLAGLPLGGKEQDVILAGAQRTAHPATDEWQAARKAAGSGDLLFFNTGKSSRVDQSAYYENCLPEAFAAAAHTLYDRQKRYGNSRALKAWLEAQDRVFGNCASAEPVYPDEPGGGMTGLARADRMYQIAAAHFYAEDLEGAEQRFRAIAADNDSPWRETAEYMVARTLIREGSLLHREDAFRLAQAQLGKINAGPLQHSAQGLMEYVATLSDPAAVLKPLAGRLAVRHPGAELGRTFADATFVLTSYRFRQALEQTELPEPFDWVEALERGNADYAARRWRQARSPLWLTAALILAKGGERENRELMDAAFATPESFAGFDTVTFHGIRLTIAEGRREEARRKLDGLLAGKRRKLNSVDNAYREQRGVAGNEL